MMGCRDCILMVVAYRPAAVQPSQQLKDTDCPPPTDCNYCIIIIIIIIISLIIINNKIKQNTHIMLLILNLRLRPAN